MESENLHARGFTVGWPHESPNELDVDIGAALLELRRSFPGICIWYGAFSGSLWALLSDRLVEAKNAAGLARQLHAALARPRPVKEAGHGTSAPWSSARRHDGTWTPPTIPAPGRPAVRARRTGLVARLMDACRRRFHGGGRATQRPNQVSSARSRARTVRPIPAGFG